PGRGITFAALHGIEDRLARVLRGPDGGITGSDRLPAHDYAALALDEGMFPSRWARFRTRRLAEEVVLFGRGQRGVGIRRTDHTKLIWIDAQFGVELEAILQR